MSTYSGIFDGALPIPRSPRNGSFHTPPSASPASNSRAPSLWDGEGEDGISRKHQVMVAYLHSRISFQMWFDVNKEFLYTPCGGSRSNTPTSSYERTSAQGVLLRASRGVYVTQPSNLCPDLITAVQRLNVEVAFTMSTEVTNLIFSTMAPGQTEFILPHDSTQYQILDSFESMAKSSSNKLKRFQYTCFVRKERVILLWHDDVELILSHGDKIERQLLGVVRIGHNVCCNSSDNRRSGETRFRSFQTVDMTLGRRTVLNHHTTFRNRHSTCLLPRPRSLLPYAIPG